MTYFQSLLQRYSLVCNEWGISKKALFGITVEPRYNEVGYNKILL